MGLKEGSLESLVKSGANVSAVATTVFPQMLQALDFIAWKGIVHRDVTCGVWFLVDMASRLVPRLQFEQGVDSPLD
jgi:hypothetical protein